MWSKEATTHLHASAAALDKGDLDLARSEAEAAIEKDNGLSDAFTLQGIALAHLKRADGANLAFRKAVMLEPNRPRHSYNLGAHLFAQGDYRGARRAVTESLKDDPDFRPAKDLMDRIDARKYEDPVVFVAPDVSRIQIESIESRPDHSIPFMTGMERPWTSLGWTFVALAVVTAVCVLVFNPIPAQSLATAKGIPPLKAGFGPTATVFLMALSAISSLMWILIDVVDRRKKLVWIVPSIALASCGFHAVPHALYMFMRKTD